MKRLAVLAFLPLLSGCPLVAVGGGGIGGYIVGQLAADPIGDANALIALDAPVKAEICKSELKKPHSKGAQAFFETYCANIPTTVNEAIVTWSKVYLAVSLADHAQ